MNVTKKRLLVYTAIPLVLFFLLIFFSSFDLSLTSLATSLRNPVLDSVMLWVSNAGSGIVIFFIVTTLFLYEERKRKWIPPIWLGFAVSTAIVILLKILIMRERPFEVLNLIAFKEFVYWNSSFPSWHAAMAFSALPVIDKEFPKIKLFWILFALIVLFSRIYFAYHFLSDIIGGALIGYFSGLLFLNLWEHKKRKSLKDARKR